MADSTSGPKWFLPSGFGIFFPVNNVADCGWHAASRSFRWIICSVFKRWKCRDPILQCPASRAVKIPEVRKAIASWCSYHKIRPSNLIYFWY